MPIFKKKYTIPNKFLTIDINAEEIRCLAFYRENGNLKIIGSGKEPLERDVVRGGIIVDKRAVIGNLGNVVHDTLEEFGEKINNAIFGINGDLCFENITTAKVTRDPQFPISQYEVSGIYERLEVAAKNQTQNIQMQYTGDSEEALNLVLSSTVYTKLNNNKVSRMEGENAKQIEIAYYTAYSPSYHIKMLKQVAKKARIQVLAFAPKTFALNKALTSSNLENKDYVTIEVGSDYTSVAVVFGGGVVASQTLHIGYSHFVETISQIMGLTYGEATKVLKTHIYGKLSQSESMVIQDCLGDVLDVWLEGLEILFTEFSGVKTFAPTIYLFGKGSQLPEIMDTLDNNPWTKAIPFKAPPQIRKLELQDIGNITDSTGTVTSNNWLSTATLASIIGELT
ncbi:hypothetical protein ACFL13_02630 [Patescibacteria group bacterium]